MYSGSNALGSAIQHTPCRKIPYKYLILQFDCTHYVHWVVLGGPYYHPSRTWLF